MERDGVSGIRALDMTFVNDGSSTGNAYNDRTKVAIPQADEKMRLLSHTIQWMSDVPLPRLWYFPNGNKAMTVFTADSDFGGYHAMRDQFNTVASYGGRMSTYLMEYDMNSIINNAASGEVQGWLDHGHELAVHFDYTGINTNEATFTWSAATAIKQRDMAIFNSRFPAIQPPTSVRNHWIAWLGQDAAGNQDFVAQARLQEQFGLGIDFNYYNVYDYQGGLGFANGSGLPMRFASSSGEILNIYLPSFRTKRGTQVSLISINTCWTGR
jgi:hypothetical protein